MKMFRNMALFTIAILCLLPACAANSPAAPAVTPALIDPVVSLPDEPTSQPASTDPAPQAAPTPTIEPPPTAVPAPVNPRYQMDITFDYAERRAAVEQTITYTNNTGLPLHELVVKVESVNYTGAFDLKSLAWDDGSPVTGAGWDGAVLTVPLPEPLPAGGARSLAVAYELILPRMVENEYLRPPIFGYTDRQINLVDWYPFIPPYRESGWMVHPRGHYGEHLTYDIADYEINLRLLNAPENLVVAASGAQVPDGDWLRYRLPAARNFVFSLSPDYQVLEGRAGNVTVYSYAFPVHRVANAAVLQTTIDSLILYQELFGLYPHTTLSAVEADFLDGMEYDGLYYLSKAFYNIYSDTPADYLIAIAAHETAHQWWYALIGNNQASEPWLDEALCTYMEHIYYERYAPEALNWWWNYRINYYEPRGLIDVSIYDKHGDFQSYRDYRDAVYLNGAVFFHELRTVIGDDAFFAFLRDYAERHSGGIATRASFFAVLSEHSPLDLSSLISKYFKE
jgi:hypothetical protein